MEPRLGIYIAGPMRGIPEWNFPAFHQVHDDWYLDAQDKIFWFCPACEDEKTGFSTEGMSGTEDLTDLGFDLRRALGKDLRWIAKNADVVVVLPGWENSKGAQAEVALAHALDLIVTAYDDQADGFQDRPKGLIPVEDLWADGNDYGYRATPEDLDAHVHQDDPQPETIGLPDGEVRTVSATGGEKGKKPARFDLIPQGPLWALAELYGRGALKYEDRNWERGYPWSLSFAALNRHLWLFWQGEDYDAETGCLHLASVAWHAFALIQFYERNSDFDDRPIR